MLMANEAVARRMADCGIPLLYRVHDRPDAESVETVRGHVLAIGEAAPELLPAFVAASLMAVDVGIRKGTLAAPAADEIRKILAG